MVVFYSRSIGKDLLFCSININSMKIDLLCIGKTQEKWLQAGIKKYVDRLSHYTRFALKEVSVPSRTTSLPINQQVEIEGGVILKRAADYDVLVLLDASGRQMDSPGVAQYLQQHMNRGTRRIAFVVGGAYGFSDAVYKACHDKLSLSQLTFSHQMVRLFFVEQLYRGFTILRGESYHHG